MNWKSINNFSYFKSKMESIETRNIIEKIKYQLTQPLPGDEPRSLLAPFISGVNHRHTKPTKSSKKSAVLLLL